MSTDTYVINAPTWIVPVIFAVILFAGFLIGRYWK